MTTAQHNAITAVEAKLEAQREQASQASRPSFTSEDAQTRINELVARMEVAKLNRNRSQWDAARAELAALIGGN